MKNAHWCLFLIVGVVRSFFYCQFNSPDKFDCLSSMVAPCQLVWQEPKLGKLREANPRKSPRFSLTNSFTCQTSWQGSKSNFETSRPGIFAAGDVHGDIKLITVAWAEGIQAAIYAFKEITSPYWLNEKRLRDQRISLIGDKMAIAAQEVAPERAQERRGE